LKNINEILSVKKCKLKRDFKIGLVLSGGGTRGLAHLGVLKALAEMGIKPDIISGTSSGAIIGVLYSAGYSLEAIAEIFKINKIFQFNNLAWNNSGLLKSESCEKICKLYLKKKSFEDLQIPLIISATDILKGKTLFFSSGNLPKIIAASSALPVLFEPVRYKSHLLIDGSTISCFPVEPLVRRCNFIIGSYTNPVNEIKVITRITQLIDRSIHLCLLNDVNQKKNYCDLFIEPPLLTNYSMFDFKKVDEIREVGYEYTMGMKNEIQKLIKQVK